MGLPLAGDLLSPPIFYPAKGVALFTDLLLGVAPLYWPRRWLGADPHTAYQLWMLACWSLNFLAAYVLLRRLGLERIGAGAGAHLFAFGSPKLANIVHQQLIPQFFLVLSLLAAVELVRSGRDPRCPPAHLWWWSAALALGPAPQLATAGYALVFFEIAAVAGLALTLTVGDGRTALACVLRRAWLPLLVSGALAVAVATPLAVSYWRTAHESMMRAYSVDMLPRPLSWVLVGNLNLLYGRVHRPKTYDKDEAERRVAEIAAKVPSTAEAFLLVGHGPGPWTYLHDDAPWVALAAGVPTVNGRYGNRPRFWRLRRVHAGGPAQRAEIISSLEFWARKTGLDPNRVAWVEAPPYRPPGGE